MLERLRQFPEELWRIWLEFAPWLLIGLIFAGLISAFVPMSWVQRWLGRRGIGSILRAAIIGTPLPLCSCSVIPAALALRRSGASRGSTVSFLVATPENGADSIAVSYALLGPFLTVVRPVAAIFSAMAAGLAAQAIPERAEATGRASTDAAEEGCCGCSPAAGENSADCCNTDETARGRVAVFWHAVVDLFRDLVGWLLIGVLLAALIKALVPANTLADYGSGLAAMMVMLMVGIPMYVCATASTPIAAALLLAGVSPGTILVFLLAGPATNLATIAIIRRELGTATVAVYVAAIAVCSIGFGMLTDLIVRAGEIRIAAQVAQSHELLPSWIVLAAAVAMLVAVAAHYMAILRGRVFRRGVGGDDRAADPRPSSE